MKIVFASDSSLLLTGETPNSGIDLYDTLREAFVGRNDVSLHPAYESVLIEFDPTRLKPRQFEAHIREIVQSRRSYERKSQLFEIPVTYGGKLGPDLEEAAKISGMSMSEFIRRHTSVEYSVSFLGFAPGFPYLSGLPKELALPRKSIPRLHVPQGSVAIGGDQTGIYPREGPGGWHLIGHTPMELFSPSNEPPTLLEPGDRVRFIASEKAILG